METSPTDAELLARYAAGRSEADFRALVDRHVRAVYSACRRRLGGNGPDAEEACQAVFVILARRAPRLRLRARESLLGWLLAAARYVALNRLRDRKLREQREMEAAQMRQLRGIDPAWREARGLVDEAMDALPGKERLALQLHYLGGMTLKEVAASTGAGESTVQLRLRQGLARLRDRLRRRGVLISSVALASALSADALAAVPAGLAPSICSAAVSAPVASLASAALKAMALAKAKAAAILAAVVAAPALAAGIAWNAMGPPPPPPPAAVAPAQDDDAEWRKRTGVDPGRGPAAQARIDPSTLLGLALWLDAAKGVVADEAGRISRWEDASGQGHHLTQDEASLRPELRPNALGGRPVVRFSGTQHVANGLKGTLALPGDGLTVLAILRQREEVFAASLFKYGPDNNVHGAGIGLMGFNAWVDSPKEYGGTIDGGVRLNGQGFQRIVLQADYKSGKTELYRNGIPLSRTERAGGLKVDPKGLLQLGGNRVGRTNNAGSSNSDLAEMVIFSRALTDPERDGVDRFMQSKWGLDRLNTGVTTLAQNLPFAYYPSTKEIELAFDKEGDLVQEHLAGAHRPAGGSAANGAPGLAWATWAGDKLPGDLSKAVPAQTGSAPDLDLPGAAFDPKPNTPYVLCGWLDVPQDGTYTFVLRPQSGSVLQIGGKMLADQSASKDTWGTWNWRGGAVALRAGRHRIHLRGLAQPRRVEHAKLPLVLWSGPGFGRQPIPGSRLRRAEKETFAAPPLEGPPAVPAPKALAAIAQAPFRVLDSRSGKEVAKGVLKLDGAGRGQGRFPVGDLPAGEYAVEYSIAGTAVRLPQTFFREKFPWEGNTLGKGHDVFPPFEPVKVDGATVRVVDRAYRVNALGMLDSVLSQNRELLAGPMTVTVKAGGRDAALRPGAVSGRVLHPDQAEFTGSASGEALSISARTLVEEDGCCRVEWTIAPGPKPAPVDWMELAIPLKEEEASLFGWSAQDSMRHHYWGAVPPRGAIAWDTEQGKAPTWVPASWTKTEGPAPADGRVWDSTRNLHWTHGNQDPFVCYVWMGSEERGLAWWADRPGQFAHDGRSPIQLVCREPGRVVLRVRVIQAPTVIEKPRKLVFGLQASPTKPLRPDWRTHPVSGGGGLPVVCWGGYYCSSKYPDNRDFAVVDQIMRMALEFREGLEGEVRKKIQEIDAKRIWRDVKVFGDTDWATAQTWFMGTARWKNCAAYVEEHGTYVRMPEWQVFQDEWASHEFNRFQEGEGSGGVIAPSYHDFAVYYQNEYMRRGVSLYYDNSMPRQESNPFSLDGERDCAAGLWGLRDYYRRVWKQLKRLERDKVPPLPVDFTIHLTNCKILPMHTWSTNLLDLEQPYRKGKPFPPDYTRAMTSGRQIGTIAHGMYPLANYNDYREAATGKWTEEQALADWAMYQVHEVRSNHWADWRSEWKQWKSFRDALVKAGYGREKARVVNYWKPEAPVAVRGGPETTWIAVVPPPDAAPNGVLGAVLLQSYAENGAKAAVTWEGAKALVDHRTRKASAPGGRADVDLPGRFGTALLWAVTDPAAAPGP